jgi:hypothetical protein
MQKIGTEKPFAGMITLCLQVASPASMSRVVTTPGGKGKAVRTPTVRMPADVCVEMRPAEQHWTPSVVVVVLAAVVLVVDAVVLVVDAAVVLVVDAAVVLVVDAAVVLVVDAAVVLVVEPTVVLVVVDAACVVVVVLGGQAPGAHEPAPMLIPPWAEQLAAEARMHVSNAPVAEDCTQHCTFVGCVVVVVEVTDVVLVEVVPGVVVVLVCGAVVVVDGPGQPPPAEQASQQLETVPTQALPPFGARQRSVVRFTLQRVLPAASVRQQVE